MDTIKLINKTGYFYTHHTSTEIWWFSRIYGTDFIAMERLWIEASQFSNQKPLTFSFPPDSFYKFLGPDNHMVSSLTTSEIDLLSNCYVLPIVVECPEEGELLDTLTISHLDQPLAQILIGAEFEDIHPDLLVNLSNKGYELSTQEYRAMMEANSLSQEVDVAFMNDKYIQLLACYNVLLMNRGSQGSLIGLMQWFGFSKDHIKMVSKWNIVNDIDKFIEYDITDIPKLKNSTTTNLINFVVETSENSNFQYPLYMEQMRWKMYLIQLFMESLFLPIHLNITYSAVRDTIIPDKTITPVAFVNTHTYFDVTNSKDNSIITIPTFTNLTPTGGDKKTFSPMKQEMEKLGIPSSFSSPTHIQHPHPQYTYVGFIPENGAVEARTLSQFINAYGRIGIFIQMDFGSIKPISYETNDPYNTFIHLGDKPSFIGYRCKYIDFTYLNGTKIRYSVDISTSNISRDLLQPQIEIYSPKDNTNQVFSKETGLRWFIERFGSQLGRSSGSFQGHFPDIPEKYLVYLPKPPQHKTENYHFSTQSVIYGVPLFNLAGGFDKFSNPNETIFSDKLILINMGKSISRYGKWQITDHHGKTRTYFTQSIILYQPGTYEVTYEVEVDGIPLYWHRKYEIG